MALNGLNSRIRDAELRGMGRSFEATAGMRIADHGSIFHKWGLCVSVRGSIIIRCRLMPRSGTRAGTRNGQGMQFTTEERRRYKRVTAPAITIQVDDMLYQTHDWSMGGFMIEGYEGRLSPGALFTLKRIATLEGNLAPVRVQSRVVRADPDRQRLMVAFLAVDEHAYAILSEHMAERLRFLKEQQRSSRPSLI
jgi:hypothetical protein